MPDGGGPMNEVDEGNMMQFRCLVGHSFSPEALLDAQGEAVGASTLGCGSITRRAWLVHQSFGEAIFGKKIDIGGGDT